MNRYWKIGTGANSFVLKFLEFISKGINVGETFYLMENDNQNYLVDKRKTKFINLKSRSTATQYLKVWEAFGFIYFHNNEYVLITPLKEYSDLLELSKVFLMINSSDKKVERYRNTIRINLLVYTNAFNENDIQNQRIKKTKGLLTFEEIMKTISKYEKIISRDEYFVKKIRRKYD